MGSATRQDDWLASWPEGSALATLIRSHAWSSTPLGSIETWPPGLRTAAAIMLSARRPTSILWGPAYVLLYNDAMRPLVVAKHPAALGRPLHEVFPSLWERLSPALRDAVTTGSGEQRQIPWPCQPGAGPEADKARRLAYRLTPIRDEEGSVGGLLVLARAVSAPDKTDHEQHLASIFARAAAGLAEIGLDGRFLDVNGELCRILGRPREALLLSGLPDVTHPDDAQAGRRLRTRAAETGERLSLNERYLRPDGAVVWASCNMIRLKSEPGRPCVLLAVIFDFAKREAPARTLIESVPQLVWRAAGLGEWTWASAQWAAATGLSDEESRGLGWLDAIHPDDRDATMSAWDMVRTRGFLEIEHRIHHAGGCHAERAGQPRSVRARGRR